MSVLVSSWVWEHSKAKGTARLVLLALADHAGVDGGDAYPSVRRLSERCGISQRSVQHAIKALVGLGELDVGWQSGPHGANRYRIPIAPADSSPPKILRPADSAPDPRNIRTPPPQILHQTPADSSPEPKENRPEPSLNRHDHFDDFWAVYPLRKSKGAAKTAWVKALKRAPAEIIIAGAVAYADDPERDPDYTKHPATWLNADCWTDEKAAPKRKHTKGTKAALNALERYGFAATKELDR